MNMEKSSGKNGMILSKRCKKQVALQAWKNGVRGWINFGARKRKGREWRSQERRAALTGVKATVTDTAEVSEGVPGE